MPLDHLLSPALAFEDACAAVLDYLHAQVPLGYWSISRYDGDRQVYLQVRDDAYGTRAGDSHAWDDSFCRHMLAGAPQVAPDAMAVPEYAGAGVAGRLRIGAYVGIPLHDGGEEVFGTICGLDPERQDETLLRHAPLLRLLGTLLTTVLRSERARSDTQRLARQVARQAETDTLTGLGNRRCWERVLQEEEERCRAFGDPLSVVVLDLDGLKEVNDTEGHAAGDEVIRRTARVLRRSLRAHDLLARLGGDEFGLLLTRVAPSEVDGVVERLRAALAEGGVAVSVGHWPHSPVEALTATWERADAEMYADKHRRSRAGTARRDGR